MNVDHQFPNFQNTAVSETPFHQQNKLTMPLDDITNVLRTPTKRDKTKREVGEVKGFVRRYVRTLTPGKRKYVLSNFEIRGGEIYDSTAKVSYSMTPESVRHRMLEIQRATLSCSTVSPLKLVESDSRSFFTLGSVLEWEDEDLESNIPYSPIRRRSSACETFRSSAKSLLNETIRFLVSRAQSEGRSIRSRLNEANAYAKRLIQQYRAVEKHNSAADGGIHFMDLEVGRSVASAMTNRNVDVDSDKVATIVPLSLV